MYLALAPKSTAVYEAYKAARKCVLTEPQYPVPLHLRNAPTRLMQNLGWGLGYKYNPSCLDGEDAGQRYLPDPLRDRVFFEFNWPESSAGLETVGSPSY